MFATILCCARQFWSLSHILHTFLLLVPNKSEVDFLIKLSNWCGFSWVLSEAPLWVLCVETETGSYVNSWRKVKSCFQHSIIHNCLADGLSLIRKLLILGGNESDSCAKDLNALHHSSDSSFFFFFFYQKSDVPTTLCFRLSLLGKHILFNLIVIIINDHLISLS